MGVANYDTSNPQLVRLCVITEDKETIDIVVNEEDTIWALKIKIFEHTTLFPGKQSISYKAPDEPQAVPIQLSNEKTIRDYSLKSGQQLFLIRAASQHEPKSSSSRGGGFLGLLSKKVGCPKLCFALGRSLRKAVVGGPCSFNIHKVDTRGKQIKSEDDFEIEILHLKDNSKITTPFTIIEVCKTTSGMFSTVVFTLQKSGEYKIYIRLDGADISGSPYRGVSIDETTPKIRELAFNQDWVTEITQLYSILAQRAETVDNIFLVGHEGLLHLMRNGPRQIQHDMTVVFAYLIKKDDNKGRLVREMGINLLKLLKTDYWMAHLEIKCFVARFLVILAISEENCITILDEVGTLPLAGLARTPNPECSRGCAKVLCLMSDHLSTRLRLVKDTVFSVMYYLMQQEDVVTTYDTVTALGNLCHIDEAQNLIKENLPMVVFIAGKVNSENIHLRMQSLKILSILTAKADFSVRLYAYGLHNIVVQHAEGFMAGLVFEWETQSAKNLYLKNVNGETDPTYQEAMVKLLKAQFKDDIGCAQYSAIILANLHQHNMEEMGSFIVKGACLRMLRRMVRSADIVTQVEACKILTTLSGPEQPQEIKDALVVGGMVVALLQAVSIEKPFLLGDIMCTIANVCKYNRACLEVVSPAELDKLIDVLLRGGPATERSACLVLGNMVAIDKYRTKIVHSGGHVFFTHVIELVRVGELDLLPEIEQSELRVIKKIGKGVSGVVWKAEWKGQIVAVKSFNESNIAFNVDEFASEMALMSILRHNNVMHCLGGSRWAKKLFLVSEYFAKGSLYDLLHKRKIRLSLDRILQIAIDTAEGLNYLHNLGLIHRDIKTGNLLIAHDWTVKIGDFGVSRVVAKRMTRAVGTPCYMAPEVLEGQDYTQAADVYSYAFVIWEMLTRETPFKDTPHLEMAKLVVEDQQRPNLPETCPEPVKELVQSCWHPIPSKRPSIGDVVIFLRNLKASYTEDTLATIILPGVADEDEVDDDTSSNDSTEQTEVQEHEKEWELLCQQYKRERNKARQKEGVKVKGRSDSVFKSSSGSKKDSKLSQSKESDTPLTPTQAIPSIPSFEAPTDDDTPIGRPRSYSALPLIRIPQAGDPIPVSNELSRMSPLARDIPSVPRVPPRNQLDVFVELMVRGAQSVVPPTNMEVIIDQDEKKEDRPPRPPRVHPSPPANHVTFRDEDLDEPKIVRSSSDSSVMPTISEAEEAIVPPSPKASEEVSAPFSNAETSSPVTTETEDSIPQQPQSLEAGYPIEEQATFVAPRPSPRRNTDEPPKPISLARASTLRHQHVPSPKLYRSNTAMLPQNRSLPPHKSFTTPPAVKAEQHFTNVVLKPSPHRPADVQWSATDSKYPISPYKGDGDQDMAHHKAMIQGHAVEAELSRGKSESSGLFFFQGEQPDSVTPSRLRSNSDGTRSRSNSSPQKLIPPTTPVKDSNGTATKTPTRPSSATSPPKVESPTEKKLDNSPNTGITRRNDTLKESNDSNREIVVPLRSEYASSTDSLSWSSQGSKSIKSSNESKSGSTSTSTSIANSAESLQSSTESLRASAEVKKGPSASDLVRLFASMSGSDTSKSSVELGGRKLIRKTSADTISGKKEGVANRFIRKTSSDSIRTSSPSVSSATFMSPPIQSVSRSADSVLPANSPVGAFKDLPEPRTKPPLVPPRPSGHMKQSSADSAMREKEKEVKEKGVGRSDSSPAFTVVTSPPTSPTSPEKQQPPKQSSSRRLFHRG